MPHTHTCTQTRMPHKPKSLCFSFPNVATLLCAIGARVEVGLELVVLQPAWLTAPRMIDSGAGGERERGDDQLKQLNYAAAAT